MACGCERADCPVGSAPRPPSSVVIHVVADRSTVDGSGTAPGFLYGDGIIPAEMVRELANIAKLQPISAPQLPESRYTPSRALAEFVRARDLTCRAPGCDRPATQCDIDHTVAYAHRGATHPSNLKCLCRQHHLLKTFWGWDDEQLADGTVIWSVPDGQTHVTVPGSALLFPGLCAGVELPPAVATPDAHCGDRDAMMPRRARTRAQNHSARIAAERRHNRPGARVAPKILGIQRFRTARRHERRAAAVLGGANGDCSANPLRDRIQCVQYMYRKLTRGGIVNFRVRLQRLLDESYALFIG